jgi:hypothetical protein
LNEKICLKLKLIADKIDLNHFCSQEELLVDSKFNEDESFETTDFE